MLHSTFWKRLATVVALLLFMMMSLPSVVFPHTAFAAGHVSPTRSTSNAPMCADNGLFPPFTRQVCHWFVKAYQKFPDNPQAGVYAKMNLWAPTVAHDDDFSLAEIVAATFLPSTGSQQKVNAIEEGWVVRPSTFGDHLPHLFVKPSKGDQSATYGCWDWHGSKQAQIDYLQKNCGWHQNSTKYYPGMPMHLTSTTQQYIIAWDPAPDGIGNWWVNYNTEWVGYFKRDFWNNNFTRFTQAQWYGEVLTNNRSQGDCTQMGSGAYGGKSGAALITDMGVLASDGHQNPAKAYSYVTDPILYNIGNTTSPFNSFTYGGPGLCAT